MTELHDRFRAWLDDGPREELPRDLALHASGCPSCLQRAAAMDALLAIDPGAAPMPPVHTLPVRRRRRLGALVPAVASSTAVLGVVIAGIFAGSTLFPGAERPSVAAASETPVERGAVLGAGSDFVTVAPTASAEPTDPTPEPTADATPTEAGSAEPPPTMGGGPPPPDAPVPQLTPRPTAATTQAPVTPTPPPVSTPTPVPPTPTPVPPTPIPTPVPDDCADDLDNDADLLIDELDPGCLLDGNEASA